ncbi:hypothetical protein GCM10027275_42020 [Rhabdobacter roseus]|uniref:Uncharacterized protein (TIGR02246 family) n=1 Tax=Rhabdobacter roseus TaxID=1655419 RepID=A0A840U221_9BACT|nr:DUF4440 domain-containing protein [Rhabdobacter roseus]MBB5286180.1 uncharacterized protein (TIGR02246 family) [Rhabdobacter roseus]
MRKSILLSTLAAALLLASCEPKAKPETPPQTTAQQTAQILTDIEDVETQWAAALNAKDIDALMALYADDAVSMPDGAPALTGKAAIRAAQEQEFAETQAYSHVYFETKDVFSEGNTVTEVGTSTFTDAAGTVVLTGKYMVVFEKQSDKYLCIREIYNKDKN